MKKLIFAVLAITFMAAPMANAQRGVSKDALTSRLAKADATIADAKKAAKATTWLKHAQETYNIMSAPTANIFVGMPFEEAQINIGKPDSSNANVNLNGKAYTEHVYPWLKLYVGADNKIGTWVMTQQVSDKDLVGAIMSSYNKALELDAKKMVEPVGEGLKMLENYLNQCASVAMDAGLNKLAAECYARAYAVQESAGFTGVPNKQYLFYSGFLYVVDAQTNNNLASYSAGSVVLNKALQSGYTDEEGNIYYYLYLCYFGQDDSSVRVANLQRAKQLLMEGLSKYPKNDKIVEGLINIYTSADSGTLGDPSELINMVDAALARDPKNRDMWYGRGRIFFSLKNYDESIASFKKVAELDPNDAQVQFFIGYFYLVQADAMNDEINKKDYKSNAEFNEDQEKVKGVYRAAIPYLEKSYELNPKDLRNVELAKEVTFKLRDEEGMMPKYEKYNKAYQELKGAN